MSGAGQMCCDGTELCGLVSIVKFLGVLVQGDEVNIGIGRGVRETKLDAIFVVFVR